MTAPGGSGVPREAVERAARAEFAFIYVGPESWEQVSDDVRDLYRRDVRPVIAAAVPVLLEALADEWDEVRRIGATPNGQLDADEWRKLRAITVMLQATGGTFAQACGLDFGAWVRRVAVEWTEGSTK